MDFVKLISNIAVPLSVAGIIVFGLLKRINVYDVFLQGAKEGIKIGVGIIPPVVGLLAAIGMFRASGAMDFVIGFLKPLTDLIRIPPEIVPFAIMRPISGSGSLAMATDIFKNFGTDSLSGRAVSVMMGSTETTFYTLAVYFGCVKASDTRHTLKCALCADIVGIVLSVWICRWFFA